MSAFLRSVAVAFGATFVVACEFGEGAGDPLEQAEKWVTENVPALDRGEPPDTGEAAPGASAGAAGDGKPGDDGLHSVFVDPPFPVKRDLTDLHLVWFDGDGVHTARNRDGIPPEARGRVRMESLAPRADRRLPPDKIFVADVRTPLPDGSYPVQVVQRTVFEGWADEAKRGAREKLAALDAWRAAEAAKAAGNAASPEPAPGGGAPVIMYRTSWCGVCKTAERYFQARGVPCVEKDVERDPAARAEMAQKVLSIGGRPGAVPVLDIDGVIMQGFSQGEVERLLARRSKSI